MSATLPAIEFSIGIINRSSVKSAKRWKVVLDDTEAFVVTSLSGQLNGPDANENG